MKKVDALFSRLFVSWLTCPLQKHSAGLTAVTEAALAQKAGHLEMLKGGKKDAKGSNARHKN